MKGAIQLATGFGHHVNSTVSRASGVVKSVVGDLVERIPTGARKVLSNLFSLCLFALAAVALLGGVQTARADALTWPTGLDPTTVAGLFTQYIYAAIPIVVGVMAVLTGIWFVIWTIHSFVTRKG